MQSCLHLLGRLDTQLNGIFLCYELMSTAYLDLLLKTPQMSILKHLLLTVPGCSEWRFVSRGQSLIDSWEKGIWTA